MVILEDEALYAGKLWVSSKADYVDLSKDLLFWKLMSSPRYFALKNSPAWKDLNIASI